MVCLSSSWERLWLEDRDLLSRPTPPPQSLFSRAKLSDGNTDFGAPGGATYKRQHDLEGADDPAFPGALSP